MRINLANGNSSFNCAKATFLFTGRINLKEREFHLSFRTTATYISVVRNKGFSNQDFLGRVREYLPSKTGIIETDASGNFLDEIPLEQVIENTFYRFDSDALLAFSHTLEDLALEEGSGALLAALQSPEQFDLVRDRYWQLAATLDEVEVITSGKLSRCHDRLKNCHDARRLVQKFWMVLYEGKNFQALFLCEQANDAEKFEEKQFVGFYTFNSRIVTQAREDMADALGGRCPELRQFAHARKIDRAAKHLKIEFAREKEAMEIAIEKLRNHGEDYQSHHFLADLDKTLERLNRLQTHLPEMIAGKHD